MRIGSNCVRINLRAGAGTLWPQPPVCVCVCVCGGGVGGGVFVVGRKGYILQGDLPLVETLGQTDSGDSRRL